MKLVQALLLASSLVFTWSVQATIVEFRTSLGNFEVNLFDEITPKTVANFLQYVEEESYHNSVIHRLVPDFVVQGGGFAYSGELPLNAIPARAAVQNEPKLSNRKGTIAMAKLENRPNSATNQWFFNLNDNHAGQPQLDTQNGGFTVFGQISEQGMEILAAIAALPRFNLGAANSIPLRNYTNADAAAGKTVTAENLVLIESVVIVDARSNTAAGLNPVANTLIEQQPPQDNNSDNGGSLAWLVVGLAGILLVRRRRKRLV
ncbi:peptidylprolyl isomerase [Alkalimonas amylolytica]|uniref:Peptidyl-prolyl cis-trans isomerase n=1 Tax=Alkalimonas amylolytica TaxID=152573 RepID=A0A1H4DGX8_ALKAM|nr:peptidylprolyl isomerase [Alkalimonas amylolytica]SEA71766.1 MYXO-CTERM domain-containing protein [Alkalimonas amylolytica]